MTAWGWRVPLFIGCAIIPFVFWLRRTLPETEAFLHSKPPTETREVLKILAANWQIVVIGVMMSILTTTTFYTITVYTPTFGTRALGLQPVEAMIVTLCAGLSNFIWLPIGGALSDRIGRRTQLFIVPIVALLTAYAAMSWLVVDPTFTKLLLVVLWFSAIFGLYNGAMIPLLAEIMPPKVRTTGFALAFVTATAIFGGFTPTINTALIELTGNLAAPAIWVSLAAAISLTGALLSRRLASTPGLQPAMA
jgi:MHS family citrate/tricarballylate:H+ symporter-like MFS transporter